MRPAPRHLLVSLLSLLLLTPLASSESRQYLPGVRQAGGEGTMEEGIVLIATNEAGVKVYYQNDATGVDAQPHVVLLSVAACTWLTIGQIPDACTHQEILL